jgi:hypothetical protein
MVLEAGKSKIKMPADLVSGEDLLQRWHFVAMLSHSRRANWDKCFVFTWWKR